MTAGSTANYTYDGEGNVTNDGVHSYTYDSENRIVSVDGGSTASYAYDHQNRRYKKTIGSALTHYVWEDAQVLAEHNGSTGAVLIDYVYSGSRMIAKIASGSTQYFLSDRLSVRLVLDSSGNVSGRQAHLPFGEAFGESGTQEKHHFTSYERDAEGGTDYAVNRQYNESVGRFMRVDPVSGSKRNPQSLNRYVYVLNEPVGKIDPLGLCPPQLCPVGQIWSSDRCACVPSSDRDPGSDDDEEPVDRSSDLPRWGGSWAFDAIEMEQNPPVPGTVPDAQVPAPPTPLQCDADVIQAMKKAWQRSANGTARTEAGFVVYRTADGRSGIARLPNTNAFQSIRFKWAEILPSGATAVAIFHTHPNAAGSNPSTGDPPSDEATAKATGLPIYVISNRGLTVYDPATNETTKLRNNIEWQEKCK